MLSSGLGGQAVELGLEQRGAREVELAGRGDHRDGPVPGGLEVEVGHAARKPKSSGVAGRLCGLTRLRRSDCSGPGITRRRRGRGFEYLDEEGARIDEPEVLARIRELGIPPAWKDVWICPYPFGHLQATGTDAGRPQAVPLPPALARPARRREVRRHGASSPTRCRICASRVEDDLDGDELTRERVLACAVRLLDRGFFRIGSEEYTVAERVLRPGHDAQGARDARRGVRDGLRLPGQERPAARAGDHRPGGVRDRGARSSAAAAAVDELLAYKDGRRWRDVRSDDINAYIKDATGADFSAKDFRTWNATVLAAVALSVSGEVAGTKTGRKRAITRAIKEVAHYLGNTPAVCRASYIDPRVFDAYRGRARDRQPPRGGDVEPATADPPPRGRGGGARPDQRARALAGDRADRRLGFRAGLRARPAAAAAGRRAAARPAARPAWRAPRGRASARAGVTGSSGTIGWSGVTGVDGISMPRLYPALPYAYSRSSDERMMRETCICEQPTRSAISDCSRSSWKRRRRISRARSSRIPVIRSIVTPASTRSNSGSWLPIRSPALAESPSSSRTGASSERTERPSVACSASTISSGERSSRSARSATVGRAAELGPQLLARLLDRQAQLLQVARRPHVPGGVAEVAADLAEDRRHRVAREREPAVGIPAVDRLDEADRGDLHEVVERLGRAAVAQREAAGERHVALDQLFTRTRVAARWRRISRWSSRCRRLRSVRGGVRPARRAVAQGRCYAIDGALPRWAAIPGIVRVRTSNRVRDVRAG